MARWISDNNGYRTIELDIRMRIALGIEYDGSRFCGWQSQPEACGVQDALERAVAQIASESVQIVTAGRTDAGVHALNQVAHFDTMADRPEMAWVRGVNALLPASVSVLWSRVVDEDFHARFSAQARRYRYILFAHPVRPALLTSYTGWVHNGLDIEKMQVAASSLIGEHDFSAFRAAECQAKSPVKTMKQITISRQGNFVVFDFEANAFLHHMVRNMVGSLVYVGKGKHEPVWMKEILEKGDRSLAAPTFAAEGLYLSSIVYGEKWLLPSEGRLAGFAF
jgi:tRNA pseudouridine38-40 synthase